MSTTLISSGVYEDRLALRLHQIRRQAENAIRDDQKLDPPSHPCHDHRSPSMILNEYTLRTLAAQLPTRIGAARHSGLDCVRFTLAEAHAVRALLPRVLESLEEQAQQKRRTR